MPCLSCPVPIHHTGSAVAGAPGEDAGRHWHTVLGERPCRALPDDDLDYFLRRPQADPPAPARATPEPPGPVTAHALARAMAASFSR